MSNVMIDLETLGTGPRALVASIGACRFDGQGIVDRFHRNVQIFNNPGEVDRSTVEWWLRQDKAAQESLFTPAPIYCQTAAKEFSDYIVADFDRESTIWCNGATFDFPIIRSFFLGNVGRQVPWSFRQEMCLRPIRTIGAKMGFDYKTFLEQQENLVKHSAVQDAVAQAEYLRAVFAQLGVPL